MSPNTEREYRDALTAAGLLDGASDALPELDVLRSAVLAQRPLRLGPQHVSSASRWLEHIREMLKSGAGPTAIYDRLRLEHSDFKTTLSAVKRACLKLQRELGVDPKSVALRVETPPGSVAQVDFGYAGELIEPETRQIRRAWFFVMVLGYSRHLFARIVFDQRIETWLRLHAEAFAAFGGVPEVIVPDNLKAAVVRCAFGVDEPSVLNRSYVELARHYGFKVDPTPPNDPDKKGKVESAVKYVKNNFLLPRRDERDASVLDAQLGRWTVEIAGTRTHGTTRRKPLEIFLRDERAALQPLPARPYELVVWRSATVHRDTHVVFDRAYYSVPWRLIGEVVWVRAAGASVAIFANDVRVATHERAAPGHRRTHPEHLPEGRSPYRERTRLHWEKRGDEIDPEVGLYVREIFDNDDVLCQLRVVQAVVGHLERFPRERARRAAARARHFRNYTVAGIKKILRDALDLMPLAGSDAVASASSTTWEKPPRFARAVGDLFDSKEATTHESH
jgi:transposase